MKASLILLLGSALLALSVPHGGSLYDQMRVRIITIDETTTVYPKPTSPPPPCSSTDGDDSVLESYSTRTNPSVSSTVTRSSPTPGGTDLALKRDWDLDATDFSQLELKKSCRMLYTKEEVPLGSSMLKQGPKPMKYANMATY